MCMYRGGRKVDKDRRRPQRRFMHVVKGDMKMVGVTEEEARDGERWSLLIHSEGSGKKRK